ncbi:MAG: hypothetical protein CMLOHMNK_03639 [Steroidobacteraceae bacterium]|nr:hypothetical protein [Steroidobacteraceae bacterium]
MDSAPDEHLGTLVPVSQTRSAQRRHAPCMSRTVRAAALLGFGGLVAACSAAAPSEPGSGGARGVHSSGGAGSGATGAAGGAGGAGGSGGTTTGGGGGVGGSPPPLGWRCADQPDAGTGHACVCVEDCPGNCGLTACPPLPCCATFTSTLSGIPYPMCHCVAADSIALMGKTCATWAAGNFCSLAKPCTGTQVSSCP